MTAVPQDDKTRAMEKIRKCLALSKSANEHEAAAALRQAQKLMQMHDLDENDLDGLEFVSQFVDHQYPIAKKGTGKPKTIMSVVQLMVLAFQVVAAYEASPD